MKFLDRKSALRQIMQKLCMLASGAAVFCLLTPLLFAADERSTPGGRIIVNRASADYEDQSGATYSTVSQTITITVLAVPAIVVTPDENAPTATVAPHEQITRLFRICNTGNSEDAFTPIAAAATAPAAITAVYFDTDNSGTVTGGDVPVTLGETSTPRLAPAACHGVLFVVETNALPVDSQLTLSLTARTVLTTPGTNTAPQDTGTIINTVGRGVVLTSPTDASLPPVKLVENQPRTTAAPAQVLNYEIAFRNHGAVAARGVRVTDDLPAGLAYVPNTLRLGNRILTDAADADEGTADARRIELTIPEVAPGAVLTIHFQARLIGTVNGSGVVNFARLAATNASPVNSTAAIVVVSPVGTVYAGNSLGAARIAGARLTIATDDTGTPLATVPDIGYEPNAANVNPFEADANGNFSFALAPEQIGASLLPARYLMTVTAPNFRPRKLEMTIQPAGGTQSFFTAAIRALDGQPVAVANGFALTTTPVQLTNLAALVFNIPMFELSTLEIAKSADKQTAEIGDIISYRLQVKNSTVSTLANVIVRDTPPPTFIYANGTAQLETGRTTRAIDPQISGGDLIFNIGELAPGATVSISYRARVGASTTEGEHRNVAVASGTPPAGSRLTTQPAWAIVRVRGGVFSMRQIVIGRVYEDRNLNGRFDAGERPVAGARVYANNGQSVVTDIDGNYNMPAIAAGSLVLSLDPVTLPDGYHLLDEDGRKSADSWTRLLRTPLGGGSLLRQNFAIAPRDESVAVAVDEKVVTAKGFFAAQKPATKTEEKENKPAFAPVGLKPEATPGIAQTRTSPAEKASGTFTVETTETIAAIAPGELIVLSPDAETVIMSPALSVTARVTRDWTIEAQVNGARLSSSSIGETRVDNRNNVTTYSFVGIDLKPGANDVLLTAAGPNGERGRSVGFKVFGRGAVERVEVVTAKSQTSGAMSITVRAFDRWNNPAQDGQISIETSAGRIFVNRADEEKNSPAETSLPARQQFLTLRNGAAGALLVSDGAADTARLKVIAGARENLSEVRFDAELRPTLMVGLGEFSFGRFAPAIVNAGVADNYRARLAFYYRGRVFGESLLTLAYDSNQPLNRLTGRDRFGGFDPLERAYPLFGDTSQRFEDAQSNSKLYIRVDRGRSYAMFGDMDADLDIPTLSGYARRLTGVKLHLENANGDRLSLTGARPDTAFARDVIPGGGLSVVRLSRAEILPGSEVVTLETRDRRNPEIIIARENLIRSVDYNLDGQTGEIFFLRSIPATDFSLNPLQIVAAYEYRGAGGENSVYTGRALKNFKSLGLKFGANYVMQRQTEIGAFRLGGFDFEKTLWRGGKLNFEAAFSRGRYAAGVNVFDYYNGSFAPVDESAREHHGSAWRLKLDQPLPFFKSSLKADFSRSSAGFYNPFGATVPPGAQHLQIALEMHPHLSRNVTLGFADERNRTENVNNSRRTLSVLWSEQWRGNLRTFLGFDRRSYADHLSGRRTDSNLVTATVEYQPTDKIELSVKREQNLTEADPTYPTQTTFAAKYKLSDQATLFFTQRLAAGAITPIADLTGGGFGASNGARRQTAFGIETKIARLGALSGRYQIENGASGADNFAVIGLQNKWKLSKSFALEGGLERGFLIKGGGRSFNGATIGGEYTPVEGFRASVRYELRDRRGFGQLLSFGAAGKLGENWTTLARAQFSRTNFNNRRGAAANLTAAAAFRPLDSDKYALLFSYNRRQMFQEGGTVNGIRQADLRDRDDSLSSDGLYQVSRDLELYGRFALRFSGSGSPTNVYASNLTLLGQLRAQQRIGGNFDFALEGRWLAQPSSATFRQSAGAELGFWVMPDLRVGAGYNFTRISPSNYIADDHNRRFGGGFYFTVTTKLSNLFNLFGTSRRGLANAAEQSSAQETQIAASRRGQR